jgi:F-type H+-transporting ATPase subunit alpha
LTSKLFDLVPLEQMTAAERALREAAANIPAALCARFETADELSDADRKTIIDIARQALARFQPKPEAKPEPEPEPETQTKSKATAAATEKS